MGQYPVLESMVRVQGLEWYRETFEGLATGQYRTVFAGLRASEVPVHWPGEGLLKDNDPSDLTDAGISSLEELEAAAVRMEAGQATGDEEILLWAYAETMVEGIVAAAAAG